MPKTTEKLEHESNGSCIFLQDSGSGYVGSCCWSGAVRGLLLRRWCGARGRRRRERRDACARDADCQIPQRVFMKSWHSSRRSGSWHAPTLQTTRPGSSRSLRTAVPRWVLQPSLSVSVSPRRRSCVVGFGSCVAVGAVAARSDVCAHASPYYYLAQV